MHTHHTAATLPARPPATKTPRQDTGVYTAQIDGRFRRMTPHQLALTWWLYAAGHISRRQLRVYFACHEMAERREYTKREPGRPKVQPLFEVGEIQTLLGGKGEKSAECELRADVRRLARLGLVDLSQHRIVFAASVEQIHIDDASGFFELYAQFPNRRRTIPVPRRTLRALAAGFTRAQTAVVLAKLVRSVFWHRRTPGEEARYRIDGRTKVSWIAEVFGVSRRALIDARAHLIAIGWLTELDAPQNMLNRYGSHDVVNVGWGVGDFEADAALGGAADPSAAAKGAVDHPDGQAVGEGGGSAPPSAQIGGGSAPLLNRSSSSSRNLETRRPGPRRPSGRGPDPGSGFSLSGKGGGERSRRRPRVSGKPNLRDVCVQDLEETERLLELFDQAIAAGYVCNAAEANRLDFFSMAARARSRGARPGALFLWLLKNGKHKHITLGDEDAARARLREHDDGPVVRSSALEELGLDPFGGGGEGPRGSSAPELSEDDEAVVRACLEVASRHIHVDPAGLALEAKGWSRERWDTTCLSYRSVRPRLWWPGEVSGVDEDGEVYV